MEILSTEFEGLYVITPRVFHDERGYFFESFNKRLLDKFNTISFIQDNESKSSKNIIRGLHFQIPPYNQTKLIRVVQGTILDVVVDLRKNSSTFKKKFSIMLDDKNKKQLLVPSGFAHGFVTLSDNCIINYKVDNIYSKKHERGIIFSDNDLNINWGISESEAIISQKDSQLPYLKDLDDFFD
tara:strand:- start:2743 stop:3291 length:549 start_codon:yes stop_codon:yes gene_type:complete